MKSANSRAHRRATGSGFRTWSHKGVFSPAVSLPALFGALSFAGIAAVHAAQPGDVLPPGTVPQGGAVLSGQAVIGVPQPTPTGRLLQIDQASQRAILQWDHFNIARGSEARFNQPTPAAEALNLIRDADPTIIQGQLTANGRVYLINQNGILFDRGSQINVRGLIASSLDIPQSVFLNGLVSNPNAPVAEGRLRVLLDRNGRQLTDLEGRPLTNRVSNYGEIRAVDPATGVEAGDTIMIFGPQVENRGTITANNGQVILAAGEKVFLKIYQPPVGVVNDFSMRGLVVEVQAAGRPLNLSELVAANFGTIRTDRGNTTLAGLAVNQAGRVTASTAVNTNGSIWLLAQGSLTTAPGSVTETPPLNDGTTLAEDQDYAPFRARLRMEGHTIHHQGNATIPGGTIEIVARGDAETPGRMLLGPASVLSTAGEWTDVPYSKNFLTRRVTSDDLKDAPLQKGGFLINKTVTFDIRKGRPPLFDIAEQVGGIPRSAGEKAAVGGDITVNADEFISLPGSLVDVSGGGYRYAGGRAPISFLASGSRVFDVNSAPADVIYDRVLSNTIEIRSQKWGASQFFANPLAAALPYEPGFIEGKRAGSLSLIASQIALDGSVRGGVRIGPYQRGSDALPAAGRLVLGDPGPATQQTPDFSLLDVSFAPLASALSPDFGIGERLPAERRDKVGVPSGLFAQGSGAGPREYAIPSFGSVEVYADGKVEVAPGTAVTLAPGGSAQMIGRQMSVGGTLSVPGGRIALETRNTRDGQGDANVVVRSGGRLSAAGMWVNDSAEASGAAGASSPVPTVTTGGRVDVSGFGVEVQAGAAIDVSGGARLSTTRRLTYGDAGSIAIGTGAGAGGRIGIDAFGPLRLEGQLAGYSGGANGGTLTLSAPGVIVGGSHPDSRALSLDADFLSRGGFTRYRLNAGFQAEVAPGAQIRPSAENFVVSPAAAAAQPSGTPLLSFATPERLPVEQRPAVSVELTTRTFSPDETRFPSRIEVGRGARLETDPKGSITLSSRTKLNVEGTLSAPAGQISLSLTTPGGQFFGETLRLGPEAALLATGAFLPQPAPLGRLQGQVLRGGTVSITATKNDLVLEPGSLIDVSAVNGAVDVQAGLGTFNRTSVSGEAGSIVLRASENTWLGGTLAGRAAPGAPAGSFALDLAYHGNFPTNPDDPTLDPRLFDTLHRIAVTPNPSGRPPSEPAVREARISAAQLKSGGFDRVRLAADEVIEFRGDVSLDPGRSLRLDTPEIRAADSSRVTLAAPQVALSNRLSGFRPSALAAADRIPVRTEAGDATLSVDAQLIDLSGFVTLNGFATTRLASTGDIRASAFPVVFTPTTSVSDADRALAEDVRALSGGLTTSGNLTLRAAQVYPATAVDFRISVASVGGETPSVVVPGGVVRVEQSGTPAAPAYSAGGRLTFEADRIEQAGTVKAPLGTLEFKGGSSVVLAEGSRTSVSADALTIPFGETQNGLSLLYGNRVRTFDPPAKRISVNAPDITVRGGAQLDVSGGGDTQAVEFVPGIGGSRDVLLARDTYAIVPGLANGFAPADSQIAGRVDLGFGADGARYDSLRLAGGSELPAGTYPLLPGYYALLPGAYLVKRQAASSYNDLPPGTSVTLADGAKVVAGKLAFAGSDAAESRWSGFSVQAGSDALRQAEYRRSGSAFFAAQAASVDLPPPTLPVDGGQLALAATSRLALDGNVVAAPAAGGDTGRIDIDSERIAVVSRPGSGEAPAGFIELGAERLSQFGASLLLGGTRSDTATGTRVAVGAREVRVANDAAQPLSSREIILAARDRVSVGEGARLEAAGPVAGRPRDIEIADAQDNNGALVRLSTSQQVAVRRGPERGAGLGELEIAAGAELRTSNSLLLDATQSTRLRGSLAVAPGGSASLTARNISLGETSGVTEGLIVDQAKLSTLGSLGELLLRSYTGIDLYGDMRFGSAAVERLVLDAPVIAAVPVGGRSRADFNAATIALQNSQGGASAAPAAGSGVLDLTGRRVVIGTGDKTLAGFGSVNLTAAEEIRAAGVGSLAVGGELALSAGRITAAGKSDQLVRAQDASGAWHRVLVTRPAAAAEPAAAATPGGKLAILGSRVEHRGRFDLPAGVLELSARGSAAGDGVLLGEDSVMNARGVAKSFGAETVFASGGKVTLAAATGGIEIRSSASVDVSGAQAGGDAGELAMRAPLGSLRADGALRGSAASGYRAGSTEIDVASIGDFSLLNSGLNAGGFTQGRYLRVRAGDIAIASADRVVARDTKIVADTGAIRVSGIVDASGASGGGKAELIAGTDLELRSGSRIEARGTSAASGPADAYSHGGRVELTSAAGRLSFAEGASIDVSASPTGKSDGGEILFAAPRTVRADGSPGVAMTLAGTVAIGGGARRRPGEVIVEGSRRYSGVANTAASSAADAGNPVWSEYQSFAGNAAAIRSDLALAGIDRASVRVRAGIELLNGGDMTHDTPWDLAQDAWRAGGEAGRLTLKAGGNLTVGAALGFPDDSPITGRSWSLRLVGGADLASADALATQASESAGDVVLATADARIRTGDGRIDIASGRDFRMEDARAAVYTTGQPAAEDGSANRYLSGGGSIAVRTGRDASAPATELWINDWLRRTTGTSFSIVQRRPAGWWAERSAFAQQIATFGGGDIELAAGRNISSVAAATASSGQPVPATSAGRLDVFGGGDLEVRAGGDLVGGQYLASRGSARIQTGGAFGTEQARPTLYLMGESGDPALAPTSMAIEARGDVELQAVSNPTMLPLSGASGGTPGFQSQRTAFFTYGRDTSVSVVSTSGSIAFDGQVRAVADPTGFDPLGTTWSKVLPPRVKVAALDGDVRALRPISDLSAFQTNLRLFPAADSELKVFAGGSIRDVSISAEDVDVSRVRAQERLPIWSAPAVAGATFEVPGEEAYFSRANPRLTQPSTAAQPRFQVAAESGSITDSRFYFPSASVVEAGRDLQNVILELQNLSPADRTVVRAGRDFRYLSQLGSGAPVNASNAVIPVGGPGRMVLQAGRDISFGPAGGVDAGGNAFNLSLPSGQSAALTVMAGVKGDIARSSIDALFDELMVAGKAQDAAAGEAAAARVFTPANTGPGNITMFFSRIRTSGNSPIDVLAPRGDINVGLPTPQAGDIGLVTAFGGGIRTYLGGDFNVNLSKVITLQGGDILVYSARGNIDAGRGPRDSRTTTPPRLEDELAPDAAGNPVPTGRKRLIPPLDAGGSGIRTLTSDPDGAGPLRQPNPGNIFLFAPSGFVDAGEAGVSAAGSLFVAALQVFNVSNFSAGGGSTGVPPAQSAGISAAVAGASNVAASTSQTADDLARQAGASRAPQQAFRPSFITVEVIGYGD